LSPARTLQTASLELAGGIGAAAERGGVAERGTGRLTASLVSGWPQDARIRLAPARPAVAIATCNPRFMTFASTSEAANVFGRQQLKPGKARSRAV
jgi:hypothetical protein